MIDTDAILFPVEITSVPGGTALDVVSTGIFKAHYSLNSLTVNRSILLLAPDTLQQALVLGSCFSNWLTSITFLETVKPPEHLLSAIVKSILSEWLQLSIGLESSRLIGFSCTDGRHPNHLVITSSFPWLFFSKLSVMGDALYLLNWDILIEDLFGENLVSRYVLIRIDPGTWFDVDATCFGYFCRRIKYSRLVTVFSAIPFSVCTLQLLTLSCH